MSCLVMGSGPLAALADYIAAQLNMGFNFFGIEAPESIYRALCDDCYIAGRYDEEAIYRKLHSLNMRAYVGRYSRYDEPVEFIAPEPYKPHTAYARPEYRDEHYIVATWHYHMAQRLHFIVYQCAEDATVNDPLYLALKTFSHVFDGFIVRNNEEYVAHRWMGNACDVMSEEDLIAATGGTGEQ